MSARQSLDTPREGAGSASAQGDLLRRVWREHVRMHVPVLLIAVAFMAVEGAALGAFAWLVRPLFDGLFENGSFDGVVMIGGLIAGLFVLRGVASFTQRLIVVSVGLKVTTRLQALLLRHMLTLDQRFFQDNPPGSLLERVRGDAAALQSLATTALMSLGRDSITLISLLVVMLATDWQWTLTALIGIPLLVVPLYLLHRLIRATSLQSRAAAARLSTRLDEIFHGIQTIKLNRLEKSEDARFERELKGYLRPSLRAQAGLAANPATMDLLAAAGFIAVLWFGGQQIISGEKTIGQFMSFFTALGLMFEPLRRLSNVAGQIQASLASVERIYAVFDMKPTVLQAAQAKPMATGDIRFDDVGFGYEDAPVLQGLSFLAEAGRTTALVGPSGAGKTTVFTLLTRLSDANSGTISIGGTPVEQIEIEALRDGIAVVSQESALFDETIAANIRMGRLDATEEEVREAARNASVLEFADHFPLGLDTPVGPRGSALSGGQRQRVTIARAMLKSAPVLLLDEPTSALDTRSEQLVQEALDRLSQGRTTLVIAHRLSTIRAADKIVVMEAGRVVEEGTHQTLLGLGGAYARMHALQGALN
ncbi:ABC transporter ATP-binding protein/permease [Roseibacterium sp. SDUM158016]|jgi:ATP-binding cassette subfamily B protein/subfamily B ATP-binding cassette protein MsbA|uniref:ABC transporter ATP-binding protein n=1 Tax=Roseicyclus sediminis TaxID=2980997 RepID=UPI0021CF552F|nr:ABC transporter ATP-binding protein [Roseibacterium sp. SDUM158016]MCU4654182.1 ABC transporter ATP-binding protein/permease [Roseibacterium sp. SDUM158016]